MLAADAVLLHIYRHLSDIDNGPLVFENRQLLTAVEYKMK